MHLYKDRLPLIIALIIINVGLDRYTKYLAIEHLKGEPGHSYLDGFFRLVYAQNEGAFLSLGSNTSGWIRAIFLEGLPMVLLFGILGYVLVGKGLTKIQVAAFTSVLSGGLSNIYDRLTDGWVVDFMVMGFEKLRTGVFNVADMSIMAGLFLLLIFNKPDEEEEKEEKEQAE